MLNKPSHSATFAKTASIVASSARALVSATTRLDISRLLVAGRNVCKQSKMLSCARGVGAVIRLMDCKIIFVNTCIPLLSIAKIFWRTNMKKIKISADSTCDLSPELITKYNVATMPLRVTLGEKDCLDGISIVPQDIYDYYASTKQLPKSGARSPEEYSEFFKDLLSEGNDAIVHFTISAEMSASYNNAQTAASAMKNVYVVDSRQLSTGIGLLVLDACDMAAQGMSAKEIAARATKRAPDAKSSFIVDTLEFLYKGGRCSSLAYLGANLLQIKPCLEVNNGLIGVASKPIGRYRRCVAKYCANIKANATNPDTKRCFVTHTKMDEGIAEEVVATVKSWGIFDEVLETTAGCTVTTHCGANTIGILYINDGGLK